MQYAPRRRAGNVMSMDRLEIGFERIPISKIN